MANEDNIFLKTLNFFSPANLWESVVGAVTGDNEDLKNNPNPSFDDRLGSAMNNSQLFSGIGTGIKAVENAPVVGAPLKFVLDFGNRTADSFFTGLQAEGGSSESTSFLDGWKHGWDTYGEPGHLSAGNLIGANVTDMFSSDVNGIGALNPLNPVDAEHLREVSKSTWYGDITGGVSDLAAGFITPVTPIAKVGKIAAEAKTVNTLADAEAVTEAFNSGRVGSKGNALLGLDADQRAARLDELVTESLKHSGSNSEAMNFFGPRMGHAHEQAKRIMAETLYHAGQLPEDMAKHVVGNAYLAAMGSDAARAELVAASPLIASKIANAALPPDVFDQVTKAQSALIDAFGAGQDVRVPQIISQVLETPRKVAEQKALADALEHAKLDAQQAKDFRSRLAALRPQFREKVDGKYVDTNFDTARLRESRTQAIAQHDSLKQQLDAAKAELADARKYAGMGNRDVVSKGAFQDAKAAADSKAGRDAVAAFGPYNDAADFNKALGAAEQKVADLTERLKVARSDRDLLNSTPLNDPQAMGQWADQMKSARAGTSQAVARRDLLESMNRVAKRQLREDVRVAKQMRPSLNATANWLADIESLGEGSLTMVGRVTPTYLDRAKTAYRDYIGRSYLYDAGDYSSRTIFHVHPQQILASIGTDYGRSAVQTLDRYRGQQELAMYLKKSGVYQGDEIAQAVESYLRAAPSDVASVVSRIHDNMLERIVADIAPEMSQADVTKAVSGLRSGLNGARSYLTGALQKADAEGSKWADLQEFPDETASGAFHKVDAAFLRSHLADTVPFADPAQVRKAIQRFLGDGTARMVGQGALGALDAYTAGWKLANLIRPGLFFRNMLDTGLRSLAIMGASTTVMSAVNGTRHKLRNDAFKVGDWVASKNSKAGTALEKIGMHDPEGMVRHMLGDGGVKVKVGNGKTASPSFYDLSPDGRALHTSVAANWSAMTRGMPVHEGLMNESQRVLDTMLQNRKAWDIYKADSIEWPRAYAEHAETLLASPTARKMIEQDALPAAAQMDGAQRVRELFSDPAVRDEYNQLARNLDMTREQFVEQVDWELEHMFPEAGMAQDLMAGKFRGAGGKQWIEDHFPPELRFDVPGFESIFEHSSRAADSARTLARKTIDSFFRVMMDEPDFWLVRHPVAVKAFSDQVKVEANRLLERRVAQYGDQAELTSRDISKITQRARTHAIGVVRDYMYDTTKNTALSQSLHRVVPFFGPYYDVMRAYGKLIYDDPQRLFTISGLYNAPTNINQWLGEPLIVDVNGEAIRPGQVPEQGGGEGYLVFNGVPGFNGQLRLRRSSFNTLLMGDVPWLPGWGPAVTIPASIIIGSNKELALKLSSSDNPAIRTLMQSLWPDGEVPANDISSIMKAQVPAWLRKVWDGQQGVAFARNTQYALNQAYIESQRNGTLFDYQKEFAKAQEAARSASWVNAISQFGFGISGDAAVQGRFYVDQMHQLQALAERPAGGGPSVLQQMGYPSPEAAFAEKFPEAANLRWSFTRNETGINATVQAQDAALNLQSIIDKSPDLGWFIVGADNVGGEWSQTAYNQQKTGTYGSAQKGRKTLDAGEAAAQAHEAYGWDQFTKLNTMLSNLAVQYGLEQDVVEGVKQWIVQSIGKDNPTWFAAYNDRTNKVADFYQQADLLAKDPKLAKRQDIAMYVTYRQAMDEVMQSFGIKSLAGTGQATVQARMALNTLGSQMARQNIGFQQMWDRMLYNDVKPRASDARFGYVDSANSAPDPAGVGLTG